DTHHLENANRALMAAIDLIEEAQFGYKAQGSIATLREDAYPIFEQALWVTYELHEQANANGYMDQALAVAERNKATLLVAALNESRASSFAGIPADQLELENQLKRDLTFYEQKDADLREQGGSENEQTEIQATLFRLKTKYDSLIAAFEENYPDYYALKFSRDVVNVSQIREELLDDNDLLIEYHMGDEHLYIFAVGRNTEHFIRNPIGPGFLPEIQRIRDNLTERPSGDNDFAKVSHRLYKKLLEPLEGALIGKDLLIIPDDVIGLVPFEVLTKREGRTDYLIIEHSVTYGYSATFLSQALNTSNGYSDQFLAFAPDFSDRSDEPLLTASAGRDGNSASLAPLLGAREEVEALSSAFPGDFREGSDALESTFKQSAANYGIIHLATHAIIDNVNPMNSRLLFTRSGDSLEDGNLHAWELLGMKLNAQLVVLSACNTGTGKIQKGEGVLSLGRAFAFAGCPSNLMSLWPAQDASTAKIMKAFYSNLSAGMRKDQALRSAKLDYLMQSEDFVRHPYYWAGFILQGDSSPLALPKKSYLSVIILSALALIVLGYWVMKKPGSHSS
ncbi:MAG: CHAT domain-containing protein, partial [Saprospiraceae bacterium]|nr:CHAT domain-containing protein [Saprospiraceae bacterium]